MSLCLEFKTNVLAEPSLTFENIIVQNMHEKQCKTAPSPAQPLFPLPTLRES